MSIVSLVVGRLAHFHPGCFFNNNFHTDVAGGLLFLPQLVSEIHNFQTI